MLQNYSNLFHKTAVVIGLALWVFLGFMLAQALLIALMYLVGVLGVSFEGVNENVFNSVVTAVVYILSVAIVIGGPWVAKKRKTTLKDIGLHRFPSWPDILAAPAGYIVYMVLSMVAVALSMVLLPFIDFEQAQDVGFSNLVHNYEYFLAFLGLVVLAPVAEEILFRGYLLQKLRKRAPTWIAILITSLLFAVVHFAWNVGIDTFALSIVLCLLRVYTKSLWAPILLHSLKNGIAFYLLFINPMLLTTIGG